MSINAAREGHTYPETAPYTVSREAIIEFARAIQATHPSYLDPEAAQAQGHRDLIAPPTFAVIIAQRAEAAAIADPELGIDFSRVVHADERFTHHHPIFAGESIIASTSIERIRLMGAGAMVTMRTELHTHNGEPRSTVVSSLIVRAHDNGDDRRPAKAQEAPA